MRPYYPINGGQYDGKRGFIIVTCISVYERIGQ